MGNMRQVYDRDHDHDCGCKHVDENRCYDNEKFPYVEKMALAMAYVPWQEWNCVYDGSEGLRAGTIFPELEKEFYGSLCGLRKGER